MMKDAFLSAGQEEPRLIWSRGETMAAFSSNVIVEPLEQLVKMERVDSYRVVERFALHGATEDGDCHWLVYNQHQPASEERPFPAPMRIAFCEAIINDALRHCAQQPRCCGFIFGGDGNCSLASWSAAFDASSGWSLTFQQPSFLHGVGRKDGDLMVAAVVKVLTSRFMKTAVT